MMNEMMETSWQDSGSRFNPVVSPILVLACEPRLDASEFWTREALRPSKRVEISASTTKICTGDQARARGLVGTVSRCLQLWAGETVR